MTFIAAKCPNCNGSMQVPDDRDFIICMYCGTNVKVRDAIKIVFDSNIPSWMKLANSALQASNNAEAYQYFNKILEVDPENAEAWKGKGLAAGWMSTLSNFRLPEMVTAFQHTIEVTPLEEQESLKNELANQITNVTSAYYSLAKSHMQEYISLDNTWNEYLNQCVYMLDALEIAKEYSSQDIPILEWLIHICKDNIEGIVYYDQYDTVNGQPTKKIQYLGAEYENIMLTKFNSYVIEMKILNPSYIEPKISRGSQKKTGCFVATAVMGDYNHPKVIELRNYRDEKLANSSNGKAFINFYYKYSPYVANIIKSNFVFKKIGYYLIIIPSVTFVRISRKFFL